MSPKNEIKNKLIVALDVDSFKKAKRLVNMLSPYAGMFKVGSELFTICGLPVIEYIHGKGKKVFLDLKFHDIPNTVAAAAAAITWQQRVFMFNVHSSGGFDMMRQTAKAVKNAMKRLKKSGISKPVRPKILAVTVLTSKKSKDTASEVIRLARLSKRAGLDGIVCSADETKIVKRACGKRFVVVNPGIRPLWAAKNDQKRTATPRDAVINGADFIVIGRPITQADDPRSAAKNILEEM